MFYRIFSHELPFKTAGHGKHAGLIFSVLFMNQKHILEDKKIEITHLP